MSREAPNIRFDHGENSRAVTNRLVQRIAKGPWLILLHPRSMVGETLLDLRKLVSKRVTARGEAGHTWSAGWPALGVMMAVTTISDMFVSGVRA